MTEPLAEEPREEEIEGGFSRRTIGWIAGIAVVSFLASALLSVYGRDLIPKPFSGANTFSGSALGHRALAELLKSLGLGVFPRQSFGGGSLGPGRPLVLAEPDSRLDRLASLRKEAKDRNAPLVVVLPKWRPGPPRKDRPEWLESVELLPPYQVLRTVHAVLEDDAPDGLELRLVSGDRLDCGVGREGGLAVSIRPAHLLAARAGLDPIVSCRGGSLIARLKAEGPAVYLISDPDLLNNHGLGRGANAEVIHSFLVRELGARGIVFDETIHGFERDTGLLAEALRFPLVFGLLQGMVLLGVVLWAGMGRFGKPLPPPSPLGAGKEILIDNTAKLLTNGVHSEDSLAQYFRQTTRIVAAHYFIPPDLPDPERLARLQKITAARGHKLILADVERSLWKLPLGPRGAEQAARIARRLYEWRLEMTNVHRKSP